MSDDVGQCLRSVVHAAIVDDERSGTVATGFTHQCVGSDEQGRARNSSESCVEKEKAGVRS